jgi:predicted DNA binding CopG/RHH family protein
VLAAPALEEKILTFDLTTSVTGATCDVVAQENTQINIRNVDQELVRKAKAEASRRGQTFKDFVVNAIKKSLQNGGRNEHVE